MIRIAQRLTLPLVGLVTVASASGLMFTWPYAKESASWAAQGQGQDAVNLLVVVPAMLYTLARTNRGSSRAPLVWLGIAIYLAYSYLLYAMFVHFTPLFPVYVAVLGLSFYALFGGALALRHEKIEPIARLGRRATSIYLCTTATLFALLWCAEIAWALKAGVPPPSASALGFSVNPVHVLDLAFALPGMFITGVLLARRRPLGDLFAVPMLVFSALMGLAIVGMMAAMTVHGVPSSATVGGAMMVSASVGAWLAATLLRNTPVSQPAVPHADSRAAFAQEGS